MYCLKVYRKKDFSLPEFRNNIKQLSIIKKNSISSVQKDIHVHAEEEKLIYHLFLKINLLMSIFVLNFVFK